MSLQVDALVKDVDVVITGIDPMSGNRVIVTSVELFGLP